MVAKARVVISRIADVTYIRHGNNNNMLLVVELPRSKIELEAAEVPHSIGHDEIPSQSDGI